jgi:chloramphenicol 3-O-phosphotransferase
MMRTKAMKLVFIFGGAATGKLTVSRALSRRTGLPVFHNHLVVDALLEKLPFGDPEFVRLREAMWMAGFETAVQAGRSLIFTFAPEPTVEDGFPERAASLIAVHGGETLFVRLTLARDIQEARLVEASRGEFRKLADVNLLRELRAGFEASEAKMPPADITIDTGAVEPDEAAARIAQALDLPPLPSAAGPN